MFLQREIIDAIIRLDEKMETYSRKANEKMDKFYRKMEKLLEENRREDGHISTDS